MATAVNEIAANSTSTVEANGIDNEDSINLTIGEDEENLLAEEVRKLIFLKNLSFTIVTSSNLQVLLFLLQTESHDRHKGKLYNTLNRVTYLVVRTKGVDVAILLFMMTSKLFESAASRSRDCIFFEQYTSPIQNHDRAESIYKVVRDGSSNACSSSFATSE